jgi:hypothetical protein
MHENWEIFCTSWSADQDQSAKAIKPHGGHERTRKVGPCRSTSEPAEQRRAAAFGGGWEGSHALCPYSNATRGNVDVTLRVDGTHLERPAA